MKSTLLFTTLSLAIAAPAASAKSELETLRSLCLEQERQIRQLEDENTRLRSDSGDPHSQPVSAAPVLSSATGTQTIANPTPATASSYTVKAGDNLEKIARKVGTSPEKLAKSNGLKAGFLIQPGQKLKVPGAVTPAVATAASPPADAAAPQPKTSTKIHTVKQGETFSSISKKYKISTEAMIAANPKIKPTALRPGQVINLSAGTASAPSPAQVNTPEPLANTPAEAPPAAPPVDKKLHPVLIESEMTYGSFAAQHGTNTERLNAINGLDLTDATVLAKGSELYVPAQP